MNVYCQPGTYLVKVVDVYVCLMLQYIPILFDA